MRFSKEMTFCVLGLFHVGVKTQKKKKQKGKLQNMPTKIVFWEVGWEKVDLAKKRLLERLQNTICVWKGNKGIFVNTIRFRKIVLFGLCKKRNTTKIGASTDTRKPENLNFS